MLSALNSPLFEGIPVVGDDRHIILHVPCKGEREGLSADNDVPAHHEDTEEHQGMTPRYGPCLMVNPGIRNRMERG